MNTKEFMLKKFFNITLEEALKFYGFSQLNQTIAKLNTENEFADTDPDLYLKLYDQQHCRDSRTPLNFAKDMIRSWVWEDIVQALLSSEEIYLYNNGSDADRDFSGRPTNKADFSVYYNNEKFDVELQICFCKTNLETGYIPVRDYKYQNMKKDKDFFLIVDLHLDQIYFTLIDMASYTEAIQVDDLANFNKPGCYLNISNEQFYNATAENFAILFKDMVAERKSPYKCVYRNY